MTIESLYLIIFVLAILAIGWLMIKPWLNRFQKSKTFDQKDFEQALRDGRIDIVVENKNGRDFAVTDAKTSARVNYAKFTQQEKWAEAERIVNDMKDVKEAMRFEAKLERLYNSDSDSEHIDAKIDIYKMVFYNKIHSRFHSYLPLNEAADHIHLPLELFSKLGEVITDEEHNHISKKYPDHIDSFRLFSNDPDQDGEDILTTKSDATVKEKAIQIKKIYDSSLPLEDKKIEINKLLNKSKALRYVFEDVGAEELLDIAA